MINPLLRRHRRDDQTAMEASRAHYASMGSTGSPSSTKSLLALAASIIRENANGSERETEQDALSLSPEREDERGRASRRAAKAEDSFDARPPLPRPLGAATGPRPQRGIRPGPSSARSTPSAGRPHARVQVGEAARDRVRGGAGRHEDKGGEAEGARLAYGSCSRAAAAAALPPRHARAAAADGGGEARWERRSCHMNISHL